MQNLNVQKFAEYIYIYKKVQNIQSIVQKKNEASFYVNSIFIFFLIMLIKI